MGKQRLYYTIADQIVELIDSGVFPPGSRLPAERDLAETFNVSRVSIREAEIALQAQGRLDIKVGSGAYVLTGGSISPRGLPKVGTIELTEARALFEAESAALAAPIITDEVIAELEGYISIMSGKLKSEMSPNDADEAFHNTIARATNNHAIMFVINSMWKMRRKASDRQIDYRYENSDREAGFLAIVEALKSRDSGAARTAMRVYFTRIIEALLMASEEKAYQELNRKVSESRSRYMLTKQMS